MSNSFYRIYEEEGVIECYLTNQKNMAIDYVKEKLPEISLTNKEKEKMTMNDVFFGRAILSQEDREAGLWDVAIGKRLALLRAKEKRNKSFFNKVNFFLNGLYIKINDFCDATDKVGKMFVSVENYHKDKLKEVL